MFISERFLKCDFCFVCDSLNARILQGYWLFAGYTRLKVHIASSTMLNRLFQSQSLVYLN